MYIYKMFEQGYVYVLSNECFNSVGSNDIFKIGYTTRDPETRVKELSNTSVFADFHIVLCKKVDNCKKVENILHTLLNKYRINNGKEFFKVDLNILKVIFDALEGDYYEETSKIKKFKIYDAWAECYKNFNIGDNISVKFKRDAMGGDFQYEFCIGKVWEFENKLYIKTNYPSEEREQFIYSIPRTSCLYLANKFLGTSPCPKFDYIDYNNQADDPDEFSEEEYEVEVEVDEVDEVDEVATQ
jgi:hypothetical protein